MRKLANPTNVKMPMGSQNFLSLDEFALAISVSKRTLYRLIDEGRIPKQVKHRGKSYLFKDDLVAYLDQLKKARA